MALSRDAGSVRLPDFLHVGAAKSGTRSVYFYLRQHPEIFMSPRKGPEFFASRFRAGRGNGPGDRRKPIIENIRNYQALFAGAGDAGVIGEGSVSYLYHHAEAIPLIREYLGDPRILITLRDPAEHAFSCYVHLKRQRRETLSFEDALAAERERMERGWHYHWHYLHSGFFADQVAAYMANFSRVKVCLLEDLQRDPAACVRDIFRFLDVDENFTPDVSTRYNVGGIPRWRVLYRLVVGGNRSRPQALQLAGRLFGEARLLRWREALRARLLVRETPDPRTRAALVRAYRPDVLRLQMHAPRRVYFDPVWEERMTMIDQALPDRVNHVWGAEDNDTRYIVYSRSDRIPGEYYLLDLKKGDLRFLMAKRKWLNPEQMGHMKPVTWKAQDGMELYGYLTIPSGREARNLPLVVNPHGGPYGIRDAWGFNEEVQLWASRGYAVFQPNFRGSGGYGRRYETAGYHKWGLEMQDDITDGVRWLIDKGIADPQHICICGASYGGYATLMGLIKTPELYRCGVDYVGVADLELLYRDDMLARETHITNYEKTETWWKMAIGDPAEEPDRFHQTSPINFVDRIQAPLLVVHGRLDPRVSKEQAQNLVGKLKQYHKDYEYIYEKWEGHGFFSEDNKFDLYRQMDAFLARHLN